MPLCGTTACAPGMRQGTGNIVSTDQPCVVAGPGRWCLHLLLGHTTALEVLTHLWHGVLVGPRSRWLLHLGRLLNSTHGLLGLLPHCLLRLLGRGGRPCPQSLKEGLRILSHACSSVKQVDQSDCKCKGCRRRLAHPDSDGQEWRPHDGRQRGARGAACGLKQSVKVNSILTHGCSSMPAWWGTQSRSDAS